MLSSSPFTFSFLSFQTPLRENVLPSFSLLLIVTRTGELEDEARERVRFGCLGGEGPHPP
jgi:hypothetical protein